MGGKDKHSLVIGVLRLSLAGTVNSFLGRASYFYWALLASHTATVEYTSTKKRHH
jgi:hypothetical protein